jgi:hypothetical protein
LHRKGDKVQLTTHPECAPYIEKFLGLDLTSRLSKPALETLSIIAYQQPVTRAQIEQVRGVNCDGVLANLLNKGLIEEVGRLETAGRPIQYGVTFAFLQHFGLRSLDDMPQLQPIEAAALEAMAARPDEPVVVADAQMALPVTADEAPKPEDKPTPPPIRETQLALVPDEASAAEASAVADEASVTNEPVVVEDAPIADEAAAADETPIEQSGGDEPPPVVEVNEATEVVDPPVDVDEAASPDQTESTAH